MPWELSISNIFGFVSKEHILKNLSKVIMEPYETKQSKDNHDMLKTYHKKSIYYSMIEETLPYKL